MRALLLLLCLASCGPEEEVPPADNTPAPYTGRWIFNCRTTTICQNNVDYKVHYYDSASSWCAYTDSEAASRVNAGYSTPGPNCRMGGTTCNRSSTKCG